MNDWVEALDAEAVALIKAAQRVHAQRGRAEYTLIETIHAITNYAVGLVDSGDYDGEEARG